jgi:hypothetical protein
MCLRPFMHVSRATSSDLGELSSAPTSSLGYHSGASRQAHIESRQVAPGHSPRGAATWPKTLMDEAEHNALKRHLLTQIDNPVDRVPVHAVEREESSWSRCVPQAPKENRSTLSSQVFFFSHMPEVLDVSNFPSSKGNVSFELSATSDG